MYNSYNTDIQILKSIQKLICHSPKNVREYTRYFKKIMKKIMLEKK